MIEDWRVLDGSLGRETNHVFYVHRLEGSVKWVSPVFMHFRIMNMEKLAPFAQPYSQ